MSRAAGRGERRRRGSVVGIVRRASHPNERPGWSSSSGDARTAQGPASFLARARRVRLRRGLARLRSAPCTMVRRSARAPGGAPPRRRHGRCSSARGAARCGAGVDRGRRLHRRRRFPRIRSPLRGFVETTARVEQVPRQLEPGDGEIAGGQIVSLRRAPSYLEGAYPLSKVELRHGRARDRADGGDVVVRGLRPRRWRCTEVTFVALAGGRDRRLSRCSAPATARRTGSSTGSPPSSATVAAVASPRS